MPDLHDTTIRIKLRSGLSANLDATVTKNDGIEGEPFYATDSHQVWIHDGTRLNNVSWPHVVDTDTAYTVALEDDVVLVDTTSGAVTITLLDPATCERKVVVIKDWQGNAAANNITIDGDGADIDGSATQIISTNYGSVRLLSDGTDWVVI